MLAIACCEGCALDKGAWAILRAARDDAVAVDCPPVNRVRQTFGFSHIGAQRPAYWFSQYHDPPSHASFLETTNEVALAARSKRASCACPCIEHAVHVSSYEEESGLRLTPSLLIARHTHGQYPHLRALRRRTQGRRVGRLLWVGQLSRLPGHESAPTWHLADLQAHEEGYLR